MLALGVTSLLLCCYPQMLLLRVLRVARHHIMLLMHLHYIGDMDLLYGQY
jgi:hypothetical protein